MKICTTIMTVLSIILVILLAILTTIMENMGFSKLVNIPLDNSGAIGIEVNQPEKNKKCVSYSHNIQHDRRYTMF